MYLDEMLTKIAIKFIAISSIITMAVADLHAQQVYKSVDKQGRVTYSEPPPKPGADDQLVGSNASNPPLPYSLQQVVNRYPVTIYTSKDCSACVSGRILLAQRGIPFTERSISSNEDIDALKRLSGENLTPVLAIGSQQLKGFDETEWSKYLDAAGYPKTSSLPRNYQQPLATPLVTLKKETAKTGADDAIKSEANKPKQAAFPAPKVNNNPNGIRF